MMISLDQWNIITNLILNKLLGNFDADFLNCAGSYLRFSFLLIYLAFYFRIITVICLCSITHFVVFVHYDTKIMILDSICFQF